MKQKHETKPNTATTNTNSRDAFAVYCHLLHGWFRQPERFEVFASRCAELAKIAVEVAKDAKIA